jgi:hypothetical protein
MGTGMNTAPHMAPWPEGKFYRVDAVDELLAAKDAELDRLRRHLESAKADRAEEYRQREAWRARHGQAVEVLRRIAETKPPARSPGLLEWMQWGYSIQSKAAASLPEEEG